MPADAVQAKRLLLAEDDRALCDLFQTALSRDGYTVVTSKNGRSALSRIASLSPAVVILDADLKPQGGTPIVKQIRRSGRMVPIVLLASSPDESLRKQCRKWVGVEYLAKPFGLLELRMALVRAASF